MKKSKATSKETIRKPAKKRSPKVKKTVDLAEVRKNITRIVSSEATEMTKAVVGEGLRGQLAPVKYLFEVSGLYPATPGTEGRPEEDSLAHRLLKHLGLPTKPVVSEDEDLPVKTMVGVAGSGAADEESGENSGAVNPQTKADESETSAADESPDAGPVNS